MPIFSIYILHVPIFPLIILEFQYQFNNDLFIVEFIKVIFVFIDKLILFI